MVYSTLLNKSSKEVGKGVSKRFSTLKANLHHSFLRGSWDLRGFSTRLCGQVCFQGGGSKSKVRRGFATLRFCHVLSISKGQ